MENKDKVQIPFLDYVVSEENFNEVPSFSNFNYVVEKKDNCFEIHFTNHLPANMHYYELDGKYAYCIDEELLADYLRGKGITLTINDNWQAYQDAEKKRGRDLKHNKYNEIPRITLYDKLTLYIDHFEVVEVTDLFSVDFLAAGDIVKTWIEKYDKLIKEHQSHLCVEMSSGLDTRSLAHFWEDDKIYEIYTKNDPDELSIVQELCAKHFPNARLVVGKKTGHEHSDEEIISLSGKGGDMFTVRFRIAEPDYYRNHICYTFARRLIKDICPYLDRDLARIKPNGPDFKAVMQYLLVPEYMDIPYKSFKREPFIFTRELRKAAHDVIETWGFEIK